jgi:hypothetical protein
VLLHWCAPATHALHTPFVQPAVPQVVPLTQPLRLALQVWGIAPEHCLSPAAQVGGVHL